ncbi:hypothetical protein DF141_16165 [Burkholderia cenocepacia]|nr:hypothetical protein DF147_08835 [Burkholderia cenocepacia]RQU74797.1 hypothetical protein DF141_16165 [Burkholderia cenocepacia]RQU86048.1 hypothetical protein DF133_23910 [Burkholderia cenocepacia]RQV15183.1 hypothetical protein DF039_20320 [Burkholderia cenocepacia]RQV90000.1 hypothetical protein DF019_10405 [Burkholderia cenocepacia]
MPDTGSPGRRAPESSPVSRPAPAPHRVTPLSATRFRLLPRMPKVAHAYRIAPIRENTEPPTTGNP